MSLISDDELNEMRQCAEAATPGPWRASLEGRDHTSGSDVILTGPDDSGPELELVGSAAADWDFVAHARMDLPRLVRELQSRRALADPETDLWAILRHDSFHSGNAKIEDVVVVKGLVSGRGTAEAEVERLNQLNAAKGARYFFQPVRWLKVGER